MFIQTFLKESFMNQYILFDNFILFCDIFILNLACLFILLTTERFVFYIRFEDNIE